MIESLLFFLESYSIQRAVSVPLATLITVLVALMLIVVVEVVLKKVLLHTIERFSAQSATRLDDLLVRYGVFNWIVRMVPPVLAYRFVGTALQFYSELVPFMKDALVIYFAVIVILFLFSALDVLNEFYSAHSVGRKLPVKSIVQVIKTLAVSIGLVIVVSKLFDKSPVVLISGIGAFTAVLLIIFKDSLLGFVAGIQLSSNDLIRIGDWIEMPKYGADGDVIDISLVTVSVQNFDNSIVVLPAYTLISEGFRNWRGMKESEGRRIKRFVNIDMQSIRFLDDTLTKRLEAIELLRPYLTERIREIADLNRSMGIDDRSPANGRRMTNLGTFRAYLQTYIRSLSNINADMMVMIRYLQPSGIGLPFEVYCFSRLKEWTAFETVQADIMDHILAVIPLFDLRVCQIQGGLTVQPNEERCSPASGSPR
ncbi:MAG: mechanosensitive ion channel family protein [Chlorobiaceae bacterium]|jgi:miniconductance mechanosensitive channel|nr:mechanosensitive ion channel family protein [Chlorobiaceae bacterium]